MTPRYDENVVRALVDDLDTIRVEFDGDRATLATDDFCMIMESHIAYRESSEHWRGQWDRAVRQRDKWMLAAFLCGLVAVVALFAVVTR